MDAIYSTLIAAAALPPVAKIPEEPKKPKAVDHFPADRVFVDVDETRYIFRSIQHWQLWKAMYQTCRYPIPFSNIGDHVEDWDDAGSADTMRRRGYALQKFWKAEGRQDFADAIDVSNEHFTLKTIPK